MNRSADTTNFSPVLIHTNPTKFNQDNSAKATKSIQYSSSKETKAAYKNVSNLKHSLRSAHCLNVNDSDFNYFIDAKNIKYMTLH